jgi:hypothetical protein
MTFQQLLEHGESLKKQGTPFKTISPATINKKIMATIKAVLNHAVARGFIPHNPAQAIKAIRQPRNTKPSRTAFTDQDLNTIFTSPFFTSTQSHQDLSERQRLDYKWMTILALLTGARVEEIASRKIEDIQNEDGIDYREPLKTLFQTELSVADPVSVRAAYGINLVFRGSHKNITKARRAWMTAGEAVRPLFLECFEDLKPGNTARQAAGEKMLADAVYNLTRFDDGLDLADTIFSDIHSETNLLWNTITGKTVFPFPGSDATASLLHSLRRFFLPSETEKVTLEKRREIAHAMFERLSRREILPMKPYDLSEREMLFLGLLLENLEGGETDAASGAGIPPEAVYMTASQIKEAYGSRQDARYVPLPRDSGFKETLGADARYRLFLPEGLHSRIVDAAKLANQNGYPPPQGSSLSRSQKGVLILGGGTTAGMFDLEAPEHTVRPIWRLIVIVSGAWGGYEVFQRDNLMSLEGAAGVMGALTGIAAGLEWGAIKQDAAGWIAYTGMAAKFLGGLTAFLICVDSARDALQAFTRGEWGKGLQESLVALGTGLAGYRSVVKGLEAISDEPAFRHALRAAAKKMLGHLPKALAGGSSPVGLAITAVFLAAELYTMVAESREPLNAWARDSVWGNLKGVSIKRVCAVAPVYAREPGLRREDAPQAGLAHEEYGLFRALHTPLIARIQSSATQDMARTLRNLDRALVSRSIPSEFMPDGRFNLPPASSPITVEFTLPGFEDGTSWLSLHWSSVTDPYTGRTTGNVPAELEQVWELDITDGQRKIRLTVVPPKRNFSWGTIPLVYRYYVGAKTYFGTVSADMALISGSVRK